jgi:hypothetical protein
LRPTSSFSFEGEHFDDDDWLVDPRCGEIQLAGHHHHVRNQRRALDLDDGAVDPRPAAGALHRLGQGGVGVLLIKVCAIEPGAMSFGTPSINSQTSGWRWCQARNS